jgi:hypothetical protein
LQRMGRAKNDALALIGFDGFFCLGESVVDVEHPAVVVHARFVQRERGGEHTPWFIRVGMQLVRGSWMVLVKRREVIVHLAFVLVGCWVDVQAVASCYDASSDVWTSKEEGEQGGRGEGTAWGTTPSGEKQAQCL